MPTKQQIKNQIDLDISNKENPNSISPLMVGGNMKAVVDKIPPLFSIEDVGETSLLKSYITDPDNETTVATVRGIKSNNLNVSISSDGNDLEIDLPSSFQGTDYYVNGNYTGDEELGTSSKPFKTLKNCIDKILNRDDFSDPLVNGGLPYNKWEFRPVSIRVRIQSYTEINENIAINNIIYLLEDGAIIKVPSSNLTLERLIDMKELVDNCPKDGDDKLVYSLSCSIVGKGKLQHHGQVRKGIARGYGHYGGSINDFQNTSYLFLGDINSEIHYEFEKRPGLTYIPLYSDVGNTIPIVREGIEMTGHVATETPDYGVIEFDGINAPFRYCLFMDGVHLLGGYEQNIFLGKNGSRLYGENGTLYLRRNYQHVNFSTIEIIETVKYYKPSEFVYDIYLKEGAGFDYGGQFYTQENTNMNQGGSEAFVCVESSNTSNTSTFNANGGGIIHRLFYNHYFKIINDSSFSIYQTGIISAKNLNINSVPFINIIEVVDENNDPKTEIIYPSRFNDCSFFDVFERGDIRKPFSNIELNQELFIRGDLIKIANSIMLPSIPTYTDNATALLANMPIGSLYKDDNEFIKIVI